MLKWNCGLGNIECILGVYRQTAVKIMEQRVEQLSFNHWQNSYALVQIDERYSCVESKGYRQWLIDAYAPEADEVLVRGA